MTSLDKKRKLKSFDELFAEADMDRVKLQRHDTPQNSDVRWLGVDSTGAAAAFPNCTYWWPVKSIDESQVEMYGDDGHGFHRRTTADKNALPRFKEEGRLKFDKSTFYNGSAPQDSLIDAFTAAVKSAEIDDEDSDDDLPDISIAHYVTTPSATQSSQKTATDSSPSILGHSHAQSPQRPRRISKVDVLDDEINIAEKEGVLAKYYKSSKVFWPARVIGFENGLYTLEYNDGTIRKHPRSAFFTSAEKGFRTCELGLLEKVSINKAPFLNTNTDTDTDVSAPSEMPPTEVFGQLDIKKQVLLCLPIINSIIAEKYTHALAKHALFIKGGESRKFVTKQVCYGAFSGYRDEIVEMIRDYLKPGEEDKEKRLVGEDAYEQLSQSERVAYMLDILFPEVLVQIVIHSEGLDKDKEEDYDRANQILKEESADRDWIDRIYAQRQFQEETKGGKADNAGEQLYHVSGRPRRKSAPRR